MRILMVRTQRGSPNGTDVFNYLGGIEYDLPDSLGVAFCEMGVARLADLPPVETPKAEFRPEMPASVAGKVALAPEPPAASKRYSRATTGHPKAKRRASK